MVHQTKLTTLLTVCSATLLLLFFVTYFTISAFGGTSSSVLPPVTVDSIPKEVEKEQVTMNIVEENVKNTKVIDTPNSNPDINVERRNKIREAFVHAYGGYEKLAFGADELRPVTNRSNASWGGFGVTIFDALDTMLLMRLDDMVERAMKFVLKVDFLKDHDASLFEFTIRYIGGLLGAFELTKERPLLYKAKELADLMLPAFNSSTGIPYSIVNLKTGLGRNPGWNGKSSILAEIGSIQLEFRYLSHHLNNPVYAEKADKVYTILGDMNKQDKRGGLYPVYVNPDTGRFANELVSLGGLGDSYYEYLLKRYVLGGKQEPIYRELYDESMQSVLSKLLQESFSEQDNRTFTFLGEYSGGRLVPEMDHLVCYVAGTLLLGAEGPTRALHTETGEKIAEACYHTYSAMPTGIGAERVGFASRQGLPDYKKRGFTVVSGKYQLRPETIEALFYGWRFTGKSMYRDWAWQIFLSIEKYCKTASSYSGLMDVQDVNGPQNDSMPSYFFAETFKYLYLIFSDNDVLPLDKYVFNTEAHPLGVLAPAQ